MNATFYDFLEKQEREDALAAASEALASKNMEAEFKEGAELVDMIRATAFFASEGDLSAPFIPTRRSDKFYMKKHTLSQRPYLHTHDFYELIFVIEGVCRQNRETVPLLHKGEACLIAPGTPHKIEKCSASDIILKAVIPSALFSRVCPQPVENVKIFPRFPAPPVIRLFCESCSDNFYKTQAEEALLKLIFIDMLRANLSFPLLDEYLNANLKTASLEDFARYSGYSVSHASRLVKARTGKSFSQLLDEARIDRACALLLSGRTALFAAAETGFATPAGFHRCFLRVKGITPAGYARSVKR